MTIGVQMDRIAMSQKERDVLKIMHGVLKGDRTQAEAAHLLDISVRQVRRIQRRLEAEGDQGLIHGLRGQPSNHRPDPAHKSTILAAYRERYLDFGPQFASEKLAEEGLVVGPQTLRRWLIEVGLWQRKRRRDPHRSRRPRRACFGELVQMDASIHDWLEGRGEELVLISMIDDATSYVQARFYAAGTTETHMELLDRWLKRHGRPLAVYTDRHSIFEPQDKGQALPNAVTQFGRACKELEIELIRAHSPQAKGRVERCFGTAQDRWVKELRLARATNAEQANAVLDRLLPGHNRRFAKAARQTTDAHRPLGSGHDLAVILSYQEERVVSNDYTVRFRNRFYQLLPPVWPGERKGKVVIELRLDGTMAIRFRDRYLKYQEVLEGVSLGGSAPKPPEFSACGADARLECEQGREPEKDSPASGVQPTDGRSGCTPAEPCPPDGERKDNKPDGRSRSKDKLWRQYGKK